MGFIPLKFLATTILGVGLAMAGMSLPVEPKIEIAGLNNAEQNCEEATFNYQEYDQKELIGLIEFWADCYGVNKQLALDLAEHESMFNSLAKNSEGSSAKGIYQFLDSTWKGTGIAKTSDCAKQMEAGKRYIQQRYGSYSAAWSFWKIHHWY